VDIVIEKLNKSYGDLTVLKDFSTVIKEGFVTRVMAPSGKGKTTLLRILMGLETADSGVIRGVEGRKMSAVFQEDRLCENLSALSNIRLVGPQREKSEIADAMAQVGLGDSLHKPARELSGGMKRRVALLRALLADYEILFLDEPFKGLDAATKEIVMADTIRRIENKTVVFVTHDPSEADALTFGDTVFL
jgi:NitT/TauT family transport system ATP-binding protein